MNELILKEKVGDKTIEIRCDFYDAINPREESHCCSHFAFRHRDYTLGDESEREWIGACESYDDARDYFRERGIDFYFEAALYDHSGLSIFLGGPRGCASDPQGWDTSPIGFAYMTEAEIEELFNGDREQAYKAIKAEIEEFNAYLNNDCYQFDILDSDGEIIDSCGGFLGDPDHALQSARLELEAIAA